MPLKIRKWYEATYLKNTFTTLFFNFHYIVLFGVFQLLMTAPLVTFGPAWLAMCGCMKMIAEDRQVVLGDYFRLFKRHFVSGLLYSLIAGTCVGGIFAALFLYRSAVLPAAAAVSACVSALLLCLTLYFPFAAVKGSRSVPALAQSFVYFGYHLVGTVSHLSLVYLLYRLLILLSPVLAALLLPPAGVYFLARFIHGNNTDIDARQEEADTKS